MERQDRPWLTLVAGVLGGAMVGLDGTAVTIAAPYVAESTGATLGQLGLIANAYIAALAIGLLPAGRLADRIGRRKTFVLGVIGFGLASLGIALSNGVWDLVFYRVLQGLAGALLQPAALALIRNAFPTKKLGLPLGVWGGANALAIGLGPIIAGVIVQGFRWQAVFLLNVPIAAITVGLTLFAAVESKGPGRSVTGTLRKLLTNRAVSLASTIVALGTFAIFTMLFVLTLYLQNVRGMPPIEAGAWMLAPTSVVVLSAPLGGLFAQRGGPRWPVAAGLVLVAVGLIGLAQLDDGSSFGTFAWSAVLFGMGTGLGAIAATETIMGASPREAAGSASALQQVASQVGGMLGILTVSTALSWQVARTFPAGIAEARLPRPVADVVTRGVESVAQGNVPAGFDSATVGAPVAAAVRAATHLSFVGAMGTALLIAAGVSLLGAVLAFWLPKSVTVHSRSDVLAENLQ